MSGRVFRLHYAPGWPGPSAHQPQQSRSHHTAPAGAANLGRTSAQAGLDVDEAEVWIRGKFGDDDEAAAQALQAYTAACDGVELW